MDNSEFSRQLQNYQGISAILKNNTYEEIVSLVSELTTVPPESLVQWPMGGYLKDSRGSAYRFVLEDLLRNVNYYDWLYEGLADDISKNVFTSLMQYRLIPGVQFLKKAYDGINHPYFDPAIVSCDENEVFVDCGGFVGDTTVDFIRQYDTYKKIYVYEPSGDHMELCRKNLENFENVSFKLCCVGEKRSKTGGKSSASLENPVPGPGEVEIVPLDEDITEKITFIKMDMGGSEIPAILGAKNHIRNDSPKLAFCTHHLISDLWAIPKLIDAINPDYQFYVRHYSETENRETVLYAIPSCWKKKAPSVCGWRNGEEMIVDGARNGDEDEAWNEGQDGAVGVRNGDMDGAVRARKKIVAMAPYERAWSNVELIKDCGLIPYILYKNYGYDVSMVGAPGGPYPYYEQYIKGVKMEFLPGGEVSEKVQYITDHAKEIDGLLLRGCYPTNFPVAEVYKQMNPAGRIYVGLDGNSYWMDRIKWDDPDFIKFMDCCDVIATSSSALQIYLNEKWPWKIEHIPNGWYDFSHQQKEPVFESKKNRILTVGRLGTVQKATEVLLEAFAEIAGMVPDWELRLIGSVEESFEAYIKDYFERFPELSERVRFMGSIADREKLFLEYQEAKIFALPSVLEGGTPNVIAEALHAGCVTAVTKFDAYEEATDSDRCGLSVEKGDAHRFAEILYRLCTDQNLKHLSEHAYLYSRRHFDMEHITAKVNEMLWAG